MQTPSRALASAALEGVLRDGSLAGEWVLDPGGSSVRLKSKVIGLVPVNGVFREVSCNGTIFPDGQVSGTFTVATATIDTKNTRRDTHLRSSDFFDSDNHPAITFTAEGIRLSGEGVEVTGELTIRDRTRPLSVDAAASVQGDGEIWLDGEVQINRADFGVTWNWMGTISMDSTLTIHAVFTRRGERMRAA
jgi:polyisoprenoid-binding protein YceI